MKVGEGKSLGRWIDPLRLYRARRWRGKLPFTRFLGYPLLGMAVGPKGGFLSFPLPLYLVDGMAVTGILAFSYALDDYLDWKLEGDLNYVGECLRSGRLTPKHLYLLIPLPLLLLLPSFLLPLSSLLLLLFFFSIQGMYSVPCPRGSYRERFKFLLSPFLAFLLTLQALLLSGSLSPPPLGLLAVAFLFQCYANSFYSLEKREKGEKGLWLFPTFSFFLSLFLLSLSPFFLLTTIFSLLRLRSVKKMGRNFHALRSRLLGPPLFCEEFMGYLFLGLAGVL